MKKTITSLFLYLITFPLSAQIPNAGFENWTSGIPDNWFSQTGYAYASSASNAHSGNLSLRFQTVQDVSGVSATTLFTRVVPNSSFFPLGLTSAPVNITFWAITSLLNGDVLTINTTLKSGNNIVGVVNGTCVSTVSPTWQFYSFPIAYSSMALPDSAAIWFSFKNGSCTPNINPLNIGTVVMIDDVAFDGTTGIHSPSNTNNFLLYPNPANEYTTLNFNQANNADIQIRLLDICGKTVKTFNENSKSTGLSSLQLNLSDISEGIYFLSVKTNAGEQVQKLIIER